MALIITLLLVPDPNTREKIRQNSIQWAKDVGYTMTIMDSEDNANESKRL